MSKYQVVLYAPTLSEQGKAVARTFEVEPIGDVDTFEQACASGEYQLAVADLAKTVEFDPTFITRIKDSAGEPTCPVLLLVQPMELGDKLALFDLGADDLVDTGVPVEETIARCRKAIFHRIAMAQLTQRLTQATETARHALVDNSDLGANVQFLLALHNCDNLDQLGQQFFSSVSRYGIKCSLQMRSVIEVKNMEATGMAKDLESQLLTQLMDGGRFIDFGRRTVINYDRVSLLIKNMPVDAPEKYGTIKDNIFALIQGVNARLIALEDKYRLEQEKEALRKLSSDVYSVMDVIQTSYQQVMKDIATSVENTAEKIQYRLPALALTEEDEAFLEEVSNESIADTNRIFNRGLKVDEYVEKLERSLGAALNAVNDKQASALSSAQDQNSNSDNNLVELF